MEESKEKLGSGERKNEGKIRFDLLEPFAIEQLAKVFTIGASKYSPNNWLKGMPWSNITASLKRHLSEYEKGIDFDQETNLLHAAHIAWNAMALLSYYKYFPQGDDRLEHTLIKPRIGLDIDEVLCDWIGPWCKKFGHEIPSDWYFSYSTKKNFEESFKNKKDLEKFYLELPSKVDPNTIPFQIDSYITSRSVDIESTKKWLEINHFPTKEVYSIGIGKSKIETAKNAGIDWFIDDNYQTYLEMNKAGICCFLWDAPHNRKYTNVGFKRIYSFEDFKNRFL